MVLCVYGRKINCKSALKNILYLYSCRFYIILIVIIQINKGFVIL